MIDEDVLTAYEHLEGVPDSLVASSIFARDVSDLESLAKAHVGERQGMKENMQDYPTTSQCKSILSK